MGIGEGRWERLRRIFDEAADRPPDERGALVAEQAAGDESLAAEVLGLLSALDSAGHLFEHPPGIAAPPDPDMRRSDNDEEAGNDGESEDAAEARLEGFRPDVAGKRIGPYRLVRDIGRGGMGMVYEAVRSEDHFEKRVALKVIRRGMDSEAIVRRFRLERQILARLEHPNIATLLDGGMTEDGQPYFAMEYVEGRPIDAHCAERRLSIPERLQLMQRVCEAVQYAHRNLVVHRDIKPGNILVTADGSVKLLDFGVAKLLNETDPDASPATLTRSGLRPLTPGYASPEQLRGEPVTTAADVYSLGVVLYELVSGRRPYTLDGWDPASIERALASPPARPSVAAASWRTGADGARDSVADGAPTAGAGEPAAMSLAAVPEPLRGTAARDLDIVILTAMHPDPGRRYGSADGLGEDLRRFLAGLPVRARKDSAGYRVRKFVGRNRAAVATGLLVVASLVSGLAFAAWQANVAREQARIAESEQAKAERVNQFLTEMLGAADPGWRASSPAFGPDVTVAEVLDAAAATATDRFPGDPAAEAAVRMALGTSYFALSRFDAAEAQFLLALTLRRDLHGGDQHPEVADVLHELGLVNYLAGDHGTALDYLARARQTYLALDVGPTQGHANAAAGVALLLTSAGRLDEAEAATLEAIEMTRHLHPEPHPTEAILTSYLGGIQERRGNLEGAVRYLLEALDIFDHLPEREYYERGSVLAGLGNIYRSLGRVEEAEPYLREALDVYLRTAGEESLFTLQGRINLANLYVVMGDLDLAYDHVEAAREVVARTLSPDHFMVGPIEITRALTLLGHGHLDEAEEAARRALALRLATYAEDDPRVAEAESTLGRVLAAAGRRDEAEPLLRISRDKAVAAFGEEDARSRRYEERYQTFLAGNTP